MPKGQFALSRLLFFSSHHSHGQTSEAQPLSFYYSASPCGVPLLLAFGILAIFVTSKGQLSTRSYTTSSSGSCTFVVAMVSSPYNIAGFTVTLGFFPQRQRSASCNTLLQLLFTTTPKTLNDAYFLSAGAQHYRNCVGNSHYLQVLTLKTRGTWPVVHACTCTCTCTCTLLG